MLTLQQLKALRKFKNGCKEKKHICSVCGASILERYWISQRAMCIGCFNEDLEDTAKNYIEERENEKFRWGEGI